jgi:hypothetical protein
MLTSNVEEGRIVLREALVGPIKFTPDEDAGVYKSKVSRRWVTCSRGLLPFPPLASTRGHDPLVSAARWGAELLRAGRVMPTHDDVSCLG